MLANRYWSPTQDLPRADRGPTLLLASTWGLPHYINTTLLGVTNFSHSDCVAGGNCDFLLAVSRISKRVNIY